MIVVYVLVCLLMLGFIGLYVAFSMCFLVKSKNVAGIYELPVGEQYDANKEKMLNLIKGAAVIPYEPCSVKSFDGLNLSGRLYEGEKDAPIALLFHGYKSNSIRDFSGGLTWCVEDGFNTIAVDERAHGNSEGTCLSFGVLERHDVLSWINFALERFGKDKKVLLVGISMGAATILMSSDLDLPENVVGMIADCGYSSPKAILRKVIKDMKLPVELAYKALRLSGKIFGGFDVESASAVEALKHAKVPVLFIHGEDDRFVPCEMSRENYEACASYKEILTVPGAGHGISYIVDSDTYKSVYDKFVDRVLGR